MGFLCKHACCKKADKNIEIDLKKGGSLVLFQSLQAC
jgi:hypothetical protein